MQLHSGPYTLPWHMNDSSDLSMQWPQMSRPYSSTDRSSSLGSMESLDTPTPTAQPYSDSHSSPVDPALFNDKRDSAYSSFSASSNTSDYAVVPLRPDETCSMENLLQSPGPAGPLYPRADSSSAIRTSCGEAPEEAQLIFHKSRSLTRPRPRPVGVKERPSSCCCETERRGGNSEIIRNEGGGAEDNKMNPPQPPNRKDSFRATQCGKHTSSTRCASDPTQVSTVASYCGENHCVDVGVHHSFSAPEDDDHTGQFRDDASGSHFMQRQTQETRRHTCDTCSSGQDLSLELNSDPLPDPVPVTSPHPAEPSAEVCEQPRSKHSSTVLHRHSAPEKLLATQLQLLQFDTNNSDTSDASSCQSFLPSHQAAGEEPEVSHNHLRPSSNKWDASRCSTPGSVFLEGDCEDGLEEKVVNTDSLSLLQHLHPWGRSLSVPEEPSGSSTQEKLSSDQILDSDFQPLSSTASVDTLVDGQRAADRRRGEEEDIEGETAVKKPNSSRNHRRNRRRSERFATNLRNEIQRKKAQLQSNRGPGGLLCSGETVQEEEGPGIHEDQAKPDESAQDRSTKVAFTSLVALQDNRTTEPVKKSNPDFIHGSSQTQLTPISQNSRSRSVQILDPGLPNFGVGIRVVEELAPAGKARRWRWTPQHKLQPEPEQQSRASGETILGVKGSQHGVCTFISSSHSRSSSCSRMEESDILPFADRMKFFEETSKGTYRPKFLGSSSCQKKQVNPPENQEPGFHPTQRRYSYQGGQQENYLLSDSVEFRRQSVSTSRDRRRQEEREERVRERERVREEEREERVRQWERERERELEQQRDREMKRFREEREKDLDGEDDARLRSRQEFYVREEREKDLDGEDDARLRSRQEFHVRENFQNLQLQSQTFSQNQDPRSAFHQVCGGSVENQQILNQQVLQQRTSSRSFTANETFPTRKQETAKLNRNYSLTERDYPSCRREARASGVAVSTDAVFNDRGRPSLAPPVAPLALRGRAMSENDLRFDSTHRWSPSVSMATSQTLSEVEERETTDPAHRSKKKTAPPPRPPPPKWDQFHRRHVSHHALFSSPSSAAPPTSSHVAPAEASRQRSFSLPPERQEVTEPCPHCSQSQTQTQSHAFSHPTSNQYPVLFDEHSFAVAPPSPIFSRHSFRPVAPPHREREQGEAESTLAPTDASVSSFSQGYVGVSVKPQQQLRILRPHCETAPPAGGEDRSRASPPQSYMDHEQQLHMNRSFQNKEQYQNPEPGTILSPSPTRSLEVDLDVPMETDIDDVQEEELPVEAEPISSELPCFALPVTVLETDIDTLPDSDASVSSTTRAESSSVEEELETIEGSREMLSLDQLFPQSSEAESGTGHQESSRGTFQNMENSTDSLDRRSGASSSCSSYYSTSAAKAQLLSQMKDFTEDRETDEDDELMYKKQLMESLRKKLGVLREAQRGLQDDIRANAQLGDEVEKMVVSVCKPNEVDKYRMFIGDLDKVVSLLLSLSGRLLRVDTTLDTLDQETKDHERLPLLEKKHQLLRQLSEAQDLKDHVDRREQAVSRVLSQCLTPEQHRDYSHFVKMKAALLVEQRQLEDKIRLGEEQLRGLRESLGLRLGLGLGLGMSMGYGHY